MTKIWKTTEITEKRNIMMTSKITCDFCKKDLICNGEYTDKDAIEREWGEVVFIFSFGSEFDGEYEMDICGECFKTKFKDKARYKGS